MAHPPSPPSNPLQSFTLNSPTGGGTRHFLIHLPTNYSPTSPTPLILAFHGKGQTAAEFESQTQLSDPEFNDWAIVAYPQGINKQWTGDPTSPPLYTINDIDFATDLLAHITSTHAIDPRRIYAVGFSNGGGLTALLAGDAHLSSKIAAFAIASGAFYKDAALKDPLFSHPSPSRSPVPILELHGDKDPVIHYDGKTTPDGETYSLPEWLEGWAQRNDAVERGSQSLLEGEVEKISWKRNGRDVLVHWKIAGFGHGWPSRRKQEDDGQRYGPVGFVGAEVVMSWLEGWVLALEEETWGQVSVH
ncbi:hypothetical protein MMC13_006461 [Lambiella insularis]|nr:hypothetical protein [Lambiella insularis]